jgi:hypothetical protein
VARGLQTLAEAHHFAARKDLDHSRSDCRELLEEEAKQAGLNTRARVDLLAALMSDAGSQGRQDVLIDPTPLCLLFGQGHQHFLDRLSSVPRQIAPPQRGKGKKAIDISELDCLAEALFGGITTTRRSRSAGTQPRTCVMPFCRAIPPTPLTKQGLNTVPTASLPWDLRRSLSFRKCGLDVCVPASSVASPARMVSRLLGRSGAIRRPSVGYAR